MIARGHAADASAAPVAERASTRGVGDLGDRPQGLQDSVIMLVDDEPTTLDILEACLEDAGYRHFVRTADARRALELVKRERPDVVLLDLRMPYVEGFEILRAIRADESLQYTPVVILTSSIDADTKLRALELGATDFLGKPVDPSELALRLRNTLGAKAYQDRLAYYDGLTGLPNRRLLMDRLQRALQRVRQDGSTCAVLHVDVDRFKQLNDALGRGIGDALLEAFAVRLENAVRATDLLGASAAHHEGGILARVGGDEFALFLPWAGSVENAGRVARQILAGLEDPFVVDEQELFLTCSVGIALFGDEVEDAETLLRHADIAMSHAKQAGRNGYQFFSDSLNAESLRRLNLETQLRRAIGSASDELRLHYQPKVDLRTGDVVGAEALMRWEHPRLGAVPPGQFIPVAEETGLIGALGGWALRTACREAKRWSGAGRVPPRISVNVSGRQFRPGDLPDVVREALRASGLPAEQLVLELTESTLMDNPQQTVEVLHRLKQTGLRLSVDDFGTGYSSLAYLKRFPLDELKIDRSFVKGVPHDSDDSAIVTSIIAMAHGLGLTVVAEGVETEEQLEFLRERGCDEFQGYLFSPALDAAEWKALLQRARGE